MNQNRKVFISYAHEDRSQVDKLEKILRDAGYDVWFDDRLKGGQDWQATILEEISKADIFVYLLSPESVASEWCVLEFTQAIKLRKPIIPILLKADTQIPQVLKQYQYVDFTEGMTGPTVARLTSALNHTQRSRAKTKSRLFTGRNLAIGGGLILVATITIVMLLPQLLSRTPPMTGDFNIVIAEFAETPANTERLTASIVEEKMRTILDTEFAPEIFGIETQIRYQGIGIVKSREEAEQAAKAHNADLVIYGSVIISGTSTEIVPRFYVSDPFRADVIEIMGREGLEFPIRFSSENDLLNTLDETLENRVTILMNFTKGLVYLQTDEYAKAARSIRDAINGVDTYEDFSGTEVLYLFASHIARLQGHFDEAKTNINKALGINPDYARGYIGRGNIYYDQAKAAYDDGDYTLAQEYLSSALSDYGEARRKASQGGDVFVQQKSDTGMGQVYTVQFLISGSYAQEALTRFQSVIDSYSGAAHELYMKGLVVNAWYWSGVIYQRRGDFDQAEEAYQEALALTDDDGVLADVETHLNEISQHRE